MGKEEKGGEKQKRQEDEEMRTAKGERKEERLKGARERRECGSVVF